MLGKHAVEILHRDHFAFAFRAEEFATSHLDESLHRAQVGVGAERLLALLAGQGRKLLMVESVERLLEASVRDAFSDLLALAKHDQSWRIILTCRDYSIDVVRSSFLEQTPCFGGFFIIHSFSTKPLGCSGRRTNHCPRTSEVSAGKSGVSWCVRIIATCMRCRYSKPLRLKTNAEVRSAGLRILDQLVDSGSSAAYRVRDDFVTPIAHQNA